MGFGGCEIQGLHVLGISSGVSCQVAKVTAEALKMGDRHNSTG